MRSCYSTLRRTRWTPLLGFARKYAWTALYALTQCTTRLFLSHQQQGISGARDDGNIGEGEGWTKVGYMGCGPSDGEAGTEKLVQVSLRRRVPPTAGRRRQLPGPWAEGRSGRCVL